MMDNFRLYNVLIRSLSLWGEKSYLCEWFVVVGIGYRKKNLIE